MAVSRQVLLERFGDLWPIHNRAMSELFILCRRHFDGDLDSALILGVVGERTFTADRGRGLSYAEFVAGKRGAGPPLPINAQSIADCTGIPRETTRRKLARLVERGWLAKTADGTLVVTERAAVELAPVTELTIDYLFTLSRALLAISPDNPADSDGDSDAASPGA